MTSINGVTERIIGAAIRIHRKYGPGLLENVYTLTLAQELLEEGLEVAVSKPLGLEHKSLKIHRAYVVDLLVENCVIVEVKTVSKIADIHIAQLLTYLRLTNLQLGLLLSFKAVRMTEGIRRVVNNYVEDEPEETPPPV
jgi:GxxExxY protein